MVYLADENADICAIGMCVGYYLPVLLGTLLVKKASRNHLFRTGNMAARESMY
jgi:hypothetical protein